MVEKKKKKINGGKNCKNRTQVPYNHIPLKKFKKQKKKKQKKFL